MSLAADDLADMARNRGLKLVRSRVRTPGKPGFGLFGLADSAGQPVFGIVGKTPTADAEAIADHLRGAETGDWKASLKSVGESRPKRKRAAVTASPADLAPEPEPQPELREAVRADAAQLAALFAMLGHKIDPADVARNLEMLADEGLPVLVIARGPEVLAVCGSAKSLPPHRPSPVGRITVLIVAELAQRQGLGRQLVEEAERRLAAGGGGLIEVTSNDRLSGAHAFYRRLGYERTSMRFAKLLPSG